LISHLYQTLEHSSLNNFPEQNSILQTITEFGPMHIYRKPFWGIKKDHP
jgi:hypothetical protein